MGCAGSVRRYAFKAELRRAIGEARARRRGIFIVCMPMQRNIDVVEQAGANHINLAAAAFLRRRPIKPDAARRSGFGKPVLDGDGGGHRACAEKVVTAGMAGGFARDRRAGRARVLVDAGQGVEFR